MAKRNVKNETKVVCPKCGTEFAIPEHEHITIGIAIGKDSNLGTISPAVVEESKSVAKTLSQMKADAKIEALRKAGVNVDNLFSMKGANGGENVARLENGHISLIYDDDPIYKSIIENGTVPNSRLFRRWVMAQVFHMMAYKGYHGKNGFTAALNAKGYKYQWKMILEELRVQVKLAERDPENFELRNDWFNNFSVAAMCVDYVQNLANHIDSLKIRHCKGVPYVKLQAKNIFVSDLDKKVVMPLKSLAEDIMSTKKPLRLYRLACKFYDLVKEFYLKHDIPMSAAFKDAYKGVGAYFTMKNMILFHGATFKNGCIKLSQEKSLEILDVKNKEYAGEGWKLFGVLKKLIADSNINIEKKMEEWRK